VYQTCSFPACVPCVCVCQTCPFPACFQVDDYFTLSKRLVSEYPRLRVRVVHLLFATSGPVETLFVMLRVSACRCFKVVQLTRLSSRVELLTMFCWLCLVRFLCLLTTTTTTPPPSPPLRQPPLRKPNTPPRQAMDAASLAKRTISLDSTTLYFSDVLGAFRQVVGVRAVLPCMFPSKGVPRSSACSKFLGRVEPHELASSSSLVGACVFGSVGIRPASPHTRWGMSSRL